MITPVILAGGSGTRLWPLSRKSYPKQFAAFDGDRSLFQDTVLRFSGAGMGRPVVVTSEDFRFIVTQQLGEVGILPEHVFVEPEGRDTAAAILLAALSLAEDPERLMLVAPSDHAIPAAQAFRGAVESGAASAREGRIVTFGIAPDRPETGYGYLELAEPVTGTTARPLLRFVEKPDQPRAEEMLATGRYVWNAGIFLMRVGTVLDAFDEHAPDLVAPVRAALDAARPDLGFLRPDAQAWGETRKVSIDYAIMERAENLMVVPFPETWTDLGDWEAVRIIRADENGLAAAGNVTAIDCRDSLLWSEGEGQPLVGLGLDNIVAVAMPDAVLVAERGRAQDVKTVVEALRAREVPQADAFRREHRPWGWFESFALGQRFQVKRIFVDPGGRLSLQSHVHRAEHWIVVEGSAEVTVGDSMQMVHENQSVYVPQGSMHRLANPGKIGLTLIEVQTGAYLGEDDIIRHEDVYSRG